MYGYIYLTTNKVNNKKYIGQHKSSKFDKTYYGSGIVFQKAFKKYGKENFSVEILCECDSPEELDNSEIYFINLYDAVNSDSFYNTIQGGYRGGNRSMIYMHNPSSLEIVCITPQKLNEYLNKGFIKGTGARSHEQIKNYSKSWHNGKRGTIIVTNNIETKYIFETELNSYISNGYRLGRIPTRPNQKQEKRK